MTRSRLRRIAFPVALAASSVMWWLVENTSHPDGAYLSRLDAILLGILAGVGSFAAVIWWAS